MPTTPKIKNRDSIFQLIKDSLMGSEHDYTKIHLSKALFLLSVPMVLEMVMESIFAVVDIYFVSHLGADAISTVGITESLMTLIYSVAFGVSIGTTALISRRIGEGKNKKAEHIAWQAMITGALISVVIAIPGLFFPKALLSIMGASENMIQSFSGYTSIMFGGNIVIMLLFINNSIFRGAGDAAKAMLILWIANGLNIILDPLLIFGWGPIPSLGIKGAAIATNIGRGVAVIVQFYMLFKTKGRIKLHYKIIRIDFKMIWKLLNVSVGAIGQSLIATVSWVFMIKLVSKFGSEVLAGYTIAIRILIFSLLPSWGLSNATSTLVGQNLGAKQPYRAEKTVWKASLINLITLGAISLLFLFYPQWFLKLFTSDQSIISYGAECLKILSYGLFFYGVGMVMFQALNGAGDTKTPMRINIIAFWLIEIPLAWIMVDYFKTDQNGIFYAIVIAESILSVIAFLIFKSGRWKHNKI